MSSIAYAPSTGAGRGGARLRLTRRGRLVVTALAAIPIVVAVVVAGLNGGGASASHDIESASFATVTVEPGQSLWDIAQKVAPSVDPRDAVNEIMDLNRLDSAMLMPGQTLSIPAF